MEKECAFVREPGLSRAPEVQVKATVLIVTSNASDVNDELVAALKKAGIRTVIDDGGDCMLVGYNRVVLLMPGHSSERARNIQQLAMRYDPPIQVSYAQPSKLLERLRADLHL